MDGLHWDFSQGKSRYICKYKAGATFGPPCCRVTEYLGCHPNRMFVRAFSRAGACALFRLAWGNSARGDLAFDRLRLLAGSLALHL
jgi:hypothetical protein